MTKNQIKINQLIEWLQDLNETYGNIPVYYSYINSYEDAVLDPMEAPFIPFVMDIYKNNSGDLQYRPIPKGRLSELNKKSLGLILK